MSPKQIPSRKEVKEKSELFKRFAKLLPPPVVRVESHPKPSTNGEVGLDDVFFRKSKGDQAELSKLDAMEDVLRGKLETRVKRLAYNWLSKKMSARQEKGLRKDQSSTGIQRGQKFTQVGPRLAQGFEEEGMSCGD
jgi:hypothetical protein